MIDRYPDWEQRLADYISPLLNDARFVWGESDCALYTADAIKAMTGHDIAADFRDKYSTAMGSARALKAYGGGDLKSTFDMLLPERPVSMARRGDAVMHDGAVGVCMGAFALFMLLPDEGDGLERIDRSEWSHAWSVGE